jgi:hypothetical protein
VKSREGDPLPSGEKDPLKRSIKREGWAMRGAAVMKDEVVWSDEAGLKDEDSSRRSNLNAGEGARIEGRDMIEGTSRHFSLVSRKF